MVQHFLAINQIELAKVRQIVEQVLGLDRDSRQALEVDPRYVRGGQIDSDDVAVFRRIFPQQRRDAAVPATGIKYARTRREPPPESVGRSRPISSKNPLENVGAFAQRLGKRQLRVVLPL